MDTLHTNVDCWVNPEATSIRKRYSRTDPCKMFSAGTTNSHVYHAIEKYGPQDENVDAASKPSRRNMLLRSVTSCGFRHKRETSGRFQQRSVKTAENRATSRWSCRSVQSQPQTESSIPVVKIHSAGTDPRHGTPRTPGFSNSSTSSFSEMKPIQTKPSSRHSSLSSKSRHGSPGKNRDPLHSRIGRKIKDCHLQEEDVVVKERRNIMIDGVTPLEKFQQTARKILTLIKTTKLTSHQRENELLSFDQYKDDILDNRHTTKYGDDLVFDPMVYRSPKQAPLSPEAKEILRQDPAERTPEQLHTALFAMQTAVEAFSEFPINMQNSLIRVGWYEQFEPKRVIIRQGHTADNFYFIVSGTAIVTLLETKKTGETYSRTLALLGRGNSFGELALMHAAKRSATVTVQDELGLLAVSREDFVNIFMHAEKDKDPEHIRYLRGEELLRGWPVDLLPRNDPKICLFMYFRRGTVMVQDSNKSDWIYFIKSGTCRVLKSLPVTTAATDDEILMQKSQMDMPASKLSSKSAPPKKTLSRNLHPTSTVQKSIALYGSNASEDEQTVKQHKKQLDVIYRMKHDEAWKHKQLAEARRRRQIIRRQFVEIQQLGAHDTFGLDHVAFSVLGTRPSVSLVSDGAEAVLINKRFFLQHINEDMARMLRTTIRPFPDEESLQHKLRLKNSWDAFKHSTVQDHVSFRKLMRQNVATSAHY